NALCESSFPWRPRPSKRMSFVSSSCPPLSRRSAFAYDSIHGDLFRASLVVPDVRGARDRGPFLDVAREARAELLRAAADRLDAQLCQAFAHIGPAHDAR